MGIVSAGGLGVSISIPDEILEVITEMGYVINAGAANLSTTSDGQTNYWGALPALAPGTTAALNKLYIPFSGTIKAAYVMWHAATAGSSGDVSMYIRLNNTTDTLIATVNSTNASKEFTNASLNIAVNAGDYIEIKNVFPTWSTNPANVRLGGIIYVE